MESTRAQRKGISLQNKYALVIRIKNGESQADVARRFELKKSTVSGIWKKRDVIIKAYEAHNHHSKRLRILPKERIETRLYTWYRVRVNANLPVNGKLFKEKAMEIAKSNGLEFKCTNRWIDRFKRRHGIFFKRKNDASDQESFKHNFWPQVRIDYTEENIFTVREVGIFYNLWPEKALNLSCDNGELADSRLTVCLCANMTGSEKRPLLIVGNKPWEVKLPVKYRCNKKCWMTLALSSEQLTIWNRELAVSNRKVLLLVKFSPAFRTLTEHSNINIGFYANDISAHPLDPALAELKLYFRKYLLEYQRTTSNISRLQCIRFLYKSWLRVSADTIAGGFQILNGPFKQKKLSLIPWAKRKGLYFDRIDDCLNFENNLVTSVHFLSDAADVGESLDDNNDLPSENEEDHLMDNVISHNEALKMANSLVRYIETKGNDSLLECMIKVEHFIEDNLNNSGFEQNKIKRENGLA